MLARVRIGILNFIKTFRALLKEYGDRDYKNRLRDCFHVIVIERMTYGLARLPMNLMMAVSFSDGEMTFLIQFSPWIPGKTNISK